MTIYKRLHNALTKRSKYEHHWISVVPSAETKPTTRNPFRRLVSNCCFAVVTKKNKSMVRSERRKLARAYAASLSANNAAKLVREMVG